MESLIHASAEEATAVVSQQPENTVVPEQLLGTWVNTNGATRGIAKVVLTAKDGKPVLQVFGACDPSACDWGEVSTTFFGKEISFPEAMALSAFFDFGFMETHLLAHVKLGVLVIAKFDRFKDSSGRSNYFSRDFFYRVKQERD